MAPAMGQSALLRAVMLSGPSVGWAMYTVVAPDSAKLNSDAFSYAGWVIVPL